MKSIPISVWLAAVVLFIFSANSAWNNPVMFFHALCFTTIAASFVRILYWFIEEKTDEN
jgi:hypothetical protein